MPRTLLPLFLVLAALPALAQDRQAIGFTQDGATFVLLNNSGLEEDHSYLFYDVRTGLQQYMGETEHFPPARFKEWVAENPLAPLKTGPRSPDGKTQLDSGKSGTWKGNRLHVPAQCSEDDENPRKKAKPRAKTLLRAKTGKKSWTSAELDLGTWNADAEVEPVWSPDGRRVAYVIHVTNGCYGAANDSLLVVGPARGPRVQLLRVKERSYDELEQAITALEGAGFAPTASDEAKGTHAGTAVFAAKGFEVEAKKAAAALPGARVDTLTWKPGFDLVVVLGSK